LYQILFCSITVFSCKCIIHLFRSSRIIPEVRNGCTYSLYVVLSQLIESQSREVRLRVSVVDRIISRRLETKNSVLNIITWELDKEHSRWSS